LPQSGIDRALRTVTCEKKEPHGFETSGSFFILNF